MRNPSRLPQNLPASSPTSQPRTEHAIPQEGRGAEDLLKNDAISLFMAPAWRIPS